MSIYVLYKSSNKVQRLNINKKTIYVNLLIIVSLLQIIGCSHKGSTSGDQNTNEASFISYALPVTQTKVKLNLTLVSCDSGIKAKGSIKTTPIVSPSPHPQHHFKLNGSNLSSFSKKHDLKVELYPHRAIKTINSTTSDRSGAIISNIFKIATSLLPFSDELGQPGVVSSFKTCNKITKDALAQAKTLKTTIADLQKMLISRQGNSVEIKKQIDVYATEITRIKANYLTIALEDRITYRKDTKNNPIKGGIFLWKGEAFKKWIGDDEYKDWLEDRKIKLVNNFSLAYCISQIVSDKNECISGDSNGLSLRKSQEEPSKPTCSTSGCTTTIVFREPINAFLTIVTKSNDFTVELDEVLIDHLPVSIAQWGEFSYLPLDAGFSESKTISLSLDTFGKRTSFGWKSGARGEEISGSLLGITDSATSYLATKKGQDLKEMQNEVTELETLQKHNKLTRCREILENGGFTCPDN
ncbi:MAG: hypothetical protein AB2777_20785 [Candidatus Thiodiazotropha endolucinida]